MSVVEFYHIYSDKDIGYGKIGGEVDDGGRCCEALELLFIR
jgi:hypothetical protein